MICNIFPDSHFFFFFLAFLKPANSSAVGSFLCLLIAMQQPYYILFNLAPSILAPSISTNPVKSTVTRIPEAALLASPLPHCLPLLHGGFSLVTNAALLKSCIRSDASSQTQRMAAQRPHHLFSA